jgi:hypothetical protein
MIRYDPRDDVYAGNDKFRRSTQVHKIRRKESKDFSVEEFPETGVMLANLRAAGNRGARNFIRFVSFLKY